MLHLNLEYGPALALSFAIGGLLAAYTSVVLQPAKPGVQRLLLTLPVAFFLLLLPPIVLNSETHLVGTLLISAFLSWWANFRLLAFSFGFGPVAALSMPPGASSLTRLAALMAVLILPIDIDWERTPWKVAARQRRLESQSSGETIEGVGKLKVVPLKEGSGPKLIKVTPSAKSKKQQRSAKASSDGPTVRQLLARSAIHWLAFFTLVFIVDTRPDLRPIAVHIIYAFQMYTYMMACFPLCAALAAAVFGVSLLPHFDNPWLSSSLADFWSRRWNLTAARTLRDAVYKPTRIAMDHIGLGIRHPEIAKGLGVLATFAASGLMHELIVYYAAGLVTWEWTALFSLQGVLYVAEEGIKKWGKTRGLELPKTLSIPLTVLTLLAGAEWLFFPPVIRTGIDVRAIAEFRSMMPL